MLEAEHQISDKPIVLEFVPQKNHENFPDDAYIILYQDPKRFLRLWILDYLYTSLPTSTRDNYSTFYDVVFNRILYNKTKDGIDFTSDFFVSNIMTIINRFKKDLGDKPKRIIPLLDNYLENERIFCDLCQKQDRFFNNVALLERIKKEKFLDKQFLQETRNSLIFLYTTLKNINKDFKNLSFERVNMLQKTESRLLYHIYKEKFDIHSF